VDSYGIIDVFLSLGTLELGFQTGEGTMAHARHELTAAANAAVSEVVYRPDL
jgi:hypothetical protein